jgi:UDP-2,3-diacylglucosamine pyrophosphatase LpxH
VSEKTVTFKRLDNHRDRAAKIPFNLETGKCVVFCDAHKWDRSKVDFFKYNEQLYYRLLDYYYELKFILILNGDIEEGMGSTLKEVTNKYPKTFEKEKKFVNRGDYYRVYGNHDHDWKDEQVRIKYLEPKLGSIDVYPALKIGEKILILHGHEGDLMADEIRHFTQILLRIFKETWETLTRKSQRVAKNYKRRKKREQYLYEWSKKNDILLIAGHTHRPMFESSSVYAKLNEYKDDLMKKFRVSKDSGKVRVSKQLETVEDNIKRLKILFPKDTEIKNRDKSLYFNAGSCLFGEGSEDDKKGEITCIEIDGGKIKLVKWELSNGNLIRGWDNLSRDIKDLIG